MTPLWVGVKVTGTMYNIYKYINFVEYYMHDSYLDFIKHKGITNPHQQYAVFLALIFLCDLLRNIFSSERYILGL